MEDRNIKVILRSIALLYWGMFLSLIVYILVSSIYVSNAGAVGNLDPQINYIIATLLIFSLIVLAPVSYLLPQRQIAKIDSGLFLAEKLLFYRKAMFVRFLTMNAAGFLVALGFLITGSTNFILVEVIVLLFFIIYKPSPFKIAADLELNEREKEKLMKD